MFNLLPEKEKKEVKRQYQTRLVIVILAFVLLIGIVSSVALLPSYVLTTYREKEVQTELDAIRYSLEQKDQDGVEERLRIINERIRAVSIAEKPQFYDLIQEILQQKGDQVHINALLVQEIQERKSTVFRLQLSGVADTRDALVAFRDILQENDVYESVELPVSSLAKQFDTDFIIDIEIII